MSWGMCMQHSQAQVVLGVRKPVELPALLRHEPAPRLGSEPPAGTHCWHCLTSRLTPGNCAVFGTDFHFRAQSGCGRPWSGLGCGSRAWAQGVAHQPARFRIRNVQQLFTVRRLPVRYTLGVYGVSCREERCVFHIPPCEIHTVCIWRILQGRKGVPV